jgi:tRNA (mo5U34)-methyltransferase
MDLNAARTLVDSNPGWYHILELGNGIVTPGHWDLRTIVGALPWPDLKGKRVLDVGTFDGFYAFWMEQQGAAEIVATDILDHRSWDWPPREREAGIRAMETQQLPKGSGFQIAKAVLSSKAEREVISIYELSPERLGTFDVVICGDLLLHLRDPLRALDAVRSVTKGHFLSVELLEPMLTVLHPKRPVATHYPGYGPRQWSIPNAAAHRAWLTVSGFEIERQTLFGLPSAGITTGRKNLAGRINQLAARKVAGGPGAPHQALLCRPEV